jgi:cytochrome c biogenesis protein CcdA
VAHGWSAASSGAESVPVAAVDGSHDFGGQVVISYVSYAFALGLVASVNPCGFPMLPAYLSFFIGAEGQEVALSVRLARAVGSAAAVTVGFTAVFAVLGGLFDAGLTVFMAWVPWIMLVMGGAFVLLGVVGVATGHLTLPIPTFTRHRTDRSAWSKVGFGVSYALASLTCSLPVFLAGIAPAFTRVGWVTGLSTFLAYAAGMSAVLMLVSLAVAVARVSIVGLLRRSGRHIARFASVVLIAVGGYLVYYWIIDLTGAPVPTPMTSIENFEASLETQLAAHRGLLAIVGGVIVFVGLCWLVVRGLERLPSEGPADYAPLGRSDDGGVAQDDAEVVTEGSPSAGASRE